MSNMKEEVEKHNAQPLFYLKDLTIYQRGKMKLNANGTASMGMNFPVCEVSEYVTEPETVLQLILKGSQAP